MKNNVNLTRSLIAGLVVAVGSIVTTPAMADVFVKEVVRAAGQQSISLILPVGTADYFSGQQTISVAADVNGASATSFIAYCVDPAHFSNTSYQDYYSPSLTSSVASQFAPQATMIQKFYDKFYAGTIGNNDNAAAFQLALWEIANDNPTGVSPTGLTSGIVQKNNSPATNPTLVANVNTLLGDLSYSGPQNYTLTLYRVNRAAGATGQDYIVATPVPEPESYGMMLAGLGLLGLIRRRSRKTC